jgi:hypothetical protein
MSSPAHEVRPQSKGTASALRWTWLPLAVRGAPGLTLAVVALVVAASVAFLILPIHLGGGTRARGDLISPLLSAAALLVSGVALVMSVRTAGAAFRAREKVGEDIAILLAALRNLRMGLGLRGALKLSEGHEYVDLVADARKAISSVCNSTTGYVLIVYEREVSEEAGGSPSEWRLLPIYLVEVLAGETAMTAALRLENLLGSLTPSDIRRMSAYVADLPSSATQFGRAYGVLDVIGRSTDDQDGTTQQPSSDDMLATFRQLKAGGVDDPDVDMFIAVLEGDDSIDALNDALARGADPNVTDKQVIARYS